MSVVFRFGLHPGLQMANLAESYEIVGRVLAKLVLSGLRRQEIEPRDIMTDLSTEKIYHFADVLSWLHAEGLMTSQGRVIDGGVFGAQLTSKGLAAVEQGTFNGPKASIRATVESKPEGLGADLYGKIGSFVGGFVGGVAQSLS